MTIKEAIKWAEDLFNKSKIKDSKNSVRFLLFQVLNKNLEYIYANLNKKLSHKQEDKFKNWVERRFKHEPVWQIIGKVKFWGMDFIVNQDVLIPRLETEILIQKVIDNIKDDKQNISILDIGTGSGAIICALKKELLNSNCFASDISEKALLVAKKNANNHKLEIDFKKGDLFEPWGGNKFDIIVANLPYIPEGDIKSIDKDVVNYEPHQALFSGKDGLKEYRRFLKILPKKLKHTGMAFLEIGKNQGKPFCDAIQNNSEFFNCQIIKDFANIDRVVIINRVDK